MIYGRSIENIYALLNLKQSIQQVVSLFGRKTSPLNIFLRFEAYNSYLWYKCGEYLFGVWVWKFAERAKRISQFIRVP